MITMLMDCCKFTLIYCFYKYVIIVFISVIIFYPCMEIAYFGWIILIISIFLKFKKVCKEIGGMAYYGWILSSFYKELIK